MQAQGRTTEETQRQTPRPTRKQRNSHGIVIIEHLPLVHRWLQYYIWTLDFINSDGYRLWNAKRVKSVGKQKIGCIIEYIGFIIKYVLVLCYLWLKICVYVTYGEVNILVEIDHIVLALEIGNCNRISTDELQVVKIDWFSQNLRNEADTHMADAHNADAHVTNLPRVERQKSRGTLFFAPKLQTASCSYCSYCSCVLYYSFNRAVFFTKPQLPAKSKGWNSQITISKGSLTAFDRLDRKSYKLSLGIRRVHFTSTICTSYKPDTIVWHWNGWQVPTCKCSSCC